MSESQMPIKREQDLENKELSALPTSIEWEEKEVDVSELLIPIKKEEEEVEEEDEVSESEEILTATPPEFCETTINTVSDLLPAKSKQRYERLYRTFVKWCNKKGINDYTEDVLLEYFKELVSQNRKALWALYSMLKCCILIHKNIDISKYPKLLAYLKSQSAHIQSKKSRALTEHHINLFIDQADDREFLLMKVALIIGVSGALRREELYQMVVNDLEFKADLIVVTVPELKTNRRRQFVIMNSKWVAVVQKYLEMRLKASKTKSRFFLKYHKGQCVNSPIGINAIGRIPSKVANYLNLDHCEEYTGHCFRRSSVTLLGDRGSHFPVSMTLGDEKNVSVAESYVENPLKRKINVATQCDEKSSANKKSNTEPQHTSTQIIIESNDAIESERLIKGLFSRVQNCKIIVNIYNNCQVNK